MEVPGMAVVTERLLHEERKQKGREEDSEVKALMSRKQPKKKGPCYQCGKYGHLKWECSESSGDRRERRRRRGDHKAHKAGTVTDDSSDSDAFVVGHEAFSVGMKCGWIVDSGATCHMCNYMSQFVEYQSLKKPEKVTLGDGHRLDAVGSGTVELVVNLPDGKRKKLKLLNTLFVFPGLSYSLIRYIKGI